ncbi:SMI1/KNR4 family protein [Rothia aerolata]|nr:SMI1/KNR4 family protein [Rothia aerolata]
MTLHGDKSSNIPTLAAFLEKYSAPGGDGSARSNVGGPGSVEPTLPQKIAQDAESATSSTMNNTPTLRRADNNGMALRTALIERGHRQGYTHEEVQAAEELRETLPEVRFLRTLVREGAIAEGPYGEILASGLSATFGAEFATGALPEDGQLPEEPEPSAVKTQLSNPGWVEIAHDSENLYAVDLDPEEGGAVGQIIDRPAHVAAAPFLVAESLSDFVAGVWTENFKDDAARLSTVVAGAPETVSGTAPVTPPEPETIPEELATSQPSDLDFDDPEDEIKDLRHELETHNADKLNATERCLAEDFATSAFGTHSEERTERVQQQLETDTELSEEPTPKTDNVPQTCREAVAQENGKNFKTALKRFFLG